MMFGDTPRKNSCVIMEKMAFRVFLLLFTFCSMVACQPNKGIEDVVSDKRWPLTIAKVSELTLDIDQETSNAIYLAQFYPGDSTDYLFLLNKYINGCNYFDLESGRQLGRISLPREGPGSVREVSGFSVVNLDSILMVARGTISRSIYTNLSGDHYPLYPFFEARSMGIDNPVAVSAAPVVLEGHRVHYVRYPLQQSVQELTANRQLFKWECVYDTLAKTIQELPIHLPEVYQGKRLNAWFIMLSRVKGHADYWVYNWPIKNNLFVRQGDSYSLHEKELAYPNAIKRVIPMAGVLSRADIRQVVENKSYIRLFYDPFRKLYYRFASLPITFDPAKHRDYYAFDYQALELSVIDTAFQIVHVSQLPPETYNVFGCFVGPRGLYIPRNNVFNPELTENEIVYDVFAPQEK